MGLSEYKRKRRFEVTPEPAGIKARTGGRQFVVHKHAASHLHYDFRLELDGVLKSWAVPKGPSLHPSTKRLAMQVEDHPVAYGDFEGIIPAGEYGGGTVLLWDRGTWEPIGNARQDFQRGRLKFKLHGQKLTGGWSLVRTGHGDDDQRRKWLLIKERDEAALAADESEIVESAPLSVLSGRDLPEIAESPERTWKSNRRRSRKAGAAASRKRVQTSAARRTPRRTAAAAAVDDSQDSYDAGRETFLGVRLTSPTKVLYPDVGVTKLDLAVYYYEIADWILPHLRNRPIVLVRCPEGRRKECFYQKHPGIGTPPSVRQISVREKTKSEKYLVVDDPDDLISLAQIGALEIHAWGSQADKLERPDRLIFDLDPAPDVAWRQVIQAAKQVRTFLQDLGLESFLKTTGGKGLHLTVPIARRHDWDEAKGFCKMVADAIVSVAPAQFTANMSKAARPGKIFIDYLRNGRGATAIVPYSTRARESAPVATPLAWDELSARLPSDHFTLQNVRQRLRSLQSDPWEGIGTLRQSLTSPARQLQRLVR